MIILFCCEPTDPKQVDSCFEDEWQAAQKAGFPVALINFEAIVAEKAVNAVARVPEQSGSAVYRGWMLKPAQYKNLYEALKHKGISLVNSPDQYKRCHYFPDSYDAIKSCTPKSIWTSPKCDLKKTLKDFGDRPIIVKDYVKSRKHEWFDACFIPNASDTPTAQRVVDKFIELQEGDLNEGLVFREFIEFEPAGFHEKSGLPIIKEFRIFFFDGDPLIESAYWPQVSKDEIPMELFKEIANKIESNFFTMDVAKRPDGEWMVIELGDGQVAGLPEVMAPLDFYMALWIWDNFHSIRKWRSE